MNTYLRYGARAARRFAIAVGALLLLGHSAVALAVTPVVKTVPWVASNPLIPHDTWSGRSITLKGTSDQQGTNFQYSWDFGDGSAPATGTVTNGFVVEATHVYTGPVGATFTARLTVTDTATGDSASQTYFVQIQDRDLGVEVNVAIDEGLWYLHKTMRRVGADKGDWLSGGNASSGYYAVTPTNVTAFFVNGHLETGAPDNPYTETVQRGMKRVFEMLRPLTITPRTYSNNCAAIGTVNPDSNGNGLGIDVSNTYPPYQGGSFIDAIVASGTPAAVTTTGPTNVIGRSYADIAQDMVDMYAFGQSESGTYCGGWRYSWNYTANSDNSTNQWAAIGMIAAEREFGLTVPAWVKTANINSVNLTQHPAGYFGYTNSTNPIWGAFAVTPSGMVQMALDGIGRGDNRWDRAENYMRTNFCSTSTSPYYNVREYYYGLFSFTKSMLLHDANGDGAAEPIDLLQCGGSAACALAPIDWYAAQVADGDQCDGVARTLVNTQTAAGYWYGNDYSGTQFPFDTGWSIIMLNRTVFSSGQPVAVAQAVPNPGVAGQTIDLDGSGSFHQDASKTIVSWAWDLDDDGQFDDATGPVASTSFPAVGNYPVGLRVCDDATPQVCDTTTVVVVISTPPLAPTADADGPYTFCPQAQPWFLDGTGSVNPDEGLSEPGQPGDTIQAYDWELNGDGQFDDAAGALPDVTAFFTAQGVGNYLIQLRVTDTSATSYPSSGFGDLSDTDTAQVSVKDAADAACSCVDNLAARPKSGKVQLTWTDSGAVSYNVYRATTSGGPYALIANTTSTYSTYLDTNVVNGTTYYYVVREAALNGDELCQSNETSATPVARGRR